MTRSPYTPPDAELGEPTAKQPVKPFAVTLLQIVGYLAVAWVAFGTALFAFLSLQIVQTDPLRVLFGIGWRVGTALALLLALIQIRGRTKVGRWLGLLLIAIPALPGFLLFGTPVHADSPSTAYTAGWNVALVLLIMPFAYWLYAFGFSRKARLYFRVHSG